MKKIRESNLVKMEQLYKLYESKMYTLAYSILKNVAQAEDVVQDSFIKLADYLDNISTADDYKTKSLALKIVKTTAINAYRRNQKESSLFDYVENQEIEDPQNIIEAKLLNMHNHAILNPIFFEMPDIYKEVIKLQYFYELTTAEISVLTGVDHSTIRKRSERAKKYVLERIGGIDNEKKSRKFISNIW